MSNHPAGMSSISMNPKAQTLSVQSSKREKVFTQKILNSIA